MAYSDFNEFGCNEFLLVSRIIFHSSLTISEVSTEFALDGFDDGLSRHFLVFVEDESELIVVLGAQNSAAKRSKID